MTEVRPEAARLAAELRLIRERAGLSFAVLGERTPYSKSAWQRYLTAKVLPSWSAVQDLCRLAGEPEPRLRALWELAETAESGRSAVAAAPAPAPPAPAAQPTPGSQGMPPPRPTPGSRHAPPPRPARDPESARETGGIAYASARKRRLRLAVAVGLTVSLIVVMIVVVLPVPPWGGGGHHATASPARQTPTGHFTVTCTAGPCTATCKAAECTGKDPGLTLCGVQARTLQQVQTPAGIGLEILYNPGCEAAWARMWNAQMGDTLTLATPGAPTQTVRIADEQDLNDFVYTPMVFVGGHSVVLKDCVVASSGPAQCYTTTVAS